VVGPSEDAIPAIQMATLGHDRTFCDVHTYFAFELRDTGFVGGFGVLSFGFAIFFGHVHIFFTKESGKFKFKISEFSFPIKIKSSPKIQQKFLLLTKKIDGLQPFFRVNKIHNLQTRRLQESWRGDCHPLERKKSPSHN
jgi:hypothetical protein